ncbi:J domain-containing protein [Marinicella meishanensis]|uniref:J domain-containing protein n=1 Tax=Marinicella meishanensis TaxID=2873263 RepID=UPI001CBCB717|nr:J domain-containing protein [Marinicella sp. NBU2979]
MFPWDVLGLAPTDDRKAIKKAYARLLRQHRPDSDPEGFKRVNEAYQAALILITQNNGQQVELDSETISNDHQEFQTKKSNDATNSLGAESKFQVDCHSVAEDLFTKTDELIKTKLKIRNDLQNWQFLHGFHDILELSFKEQVSKEMFKKVAELNHNELKTNGVLLIDRDVLILMNQIFDWDRNWQELNQLYPSTYFENTIDRTYVQSESNQIPKKHNFYKLAAFSLDMGAAALFTLFIFLKMPDDYPGYVIPVFLIIFSLMTGLTELSKYKTSLGKYTLGFRLTANGEQLASRFRILIRLMLFHGSAWCVYVSMVNGNIDMNFWFILSLVLMVSSLVIWVLKDKPLHDWLTGVTVAQIESN